MSQRQFSFLVASYFILLAGACGPIQSLTASAEDGFQLAMTSLPPLSLPLAMNELPPSARLGSLLTGSGIVDRSRLTYDDMMKRYLATPVDDGAFALPEEAAMPDVVFEGRLKLFIPGQNSAFTVVRDDLNFAADPARMQLPELDLQFVQDGSYLIPVTQGLVYSGSNYWNTIIGPGRIWREIGDHGFNRASFPFTLVERNQNCTHNGVMTFLFDGMKVSPVRYQITQETCLYFKFDLWGQVDAIYSPGFITDASALRTAHAAEVAGRLPTRPIAALADDYPDVQINLAAFGSGITPAYMSAYGLVIDGVNYVSACRTRHGEYAFCESLRLPSYSTAKSAFAAVALMRLGQKFGTAVYDLLIKDYVPESASAPGYWSEVSFRNALDMATGNYAQPDFEADEASPFMAAFLDGSESYYDKIKAAFRFPCQKSPGQAWVYHSSDTFILTRAMNNYLISQIGNGADIFNFVRDEVYLPLKLSAGTLTILRTDNSPVGAPVGGYGLFLTSDDIAKIARLLNDQNGMLDGNQLLEPSFLAAALQRNPEDRGLDTTGFPVYKYNHGFWARDWTSSDSSQHSCSFWTPFMSGYGGITVVLMPNSSIYYYFSDNNEFTWYPAVDESNKLRRMCP